MHLYVDIGMHRRPFEGQHLVFNPIEHEYIQVLHDPVGHE